MSHGRTLLLGLLTAVVAPLLSGAVREGPQNARRGTGGPEARAIGRAVTFLEREVARWPWENGCYSCHNNGDAAGALWMGLAAGRPLSRASLSGTLRWLAAPERWDDYGPQGPFGDRKLARIQFAAALARAVAAGMDMPEPARVRAAEMLIEIQAADGCWPVVAETQIGSSVTYGVPLATAVAAEALTLLTPGRSEAPTRARLWLRARRPESVLDAAACLLAAGPREDRSDCLRIIERGQAEGGGWGPYVNAAPEPFDTAVVLLALNRADPPREWPVRTRRGRDYLLRTQLPDGSWQETTRPPGGESYAQRISTTAWATRALLVPPSRR
jgi:hypothetical protein